MSNGSRSSELHRALLESSVLLVTLLFVIASIRNESAQFLGGLATFSIPFVVTMMLSVLLMKGEDSSFGLNGRVERGLGMLEFLAFFAGLLLLLAMFMNWTAGIPGALQGMGYLIAAMAILALLYATFPSRPVRATLPSQDVKVTATVTGTRKKRRRTRPPTT